MKTVGVRRQQGLVPLEKSITYGKGKLLMDMALFMGRSFRVGWGPNWTLVNCGDKLSGSSEMEDLQCETVEYGFLPTPVAPKSWVVVSFRMVLTCTLFMFERILIVAWYFFEIQLNIRFDMQKWCKITLAMEISFRLLLYKTLYLKGLE